jgi:hypothetical protein
MSKRIPETQDAPSTPQDDAVDHSRRKLTGAALGASAIFTLTSRPVWANECTISGMMSGNLSSPAAAACEGCTPGFWKQKQHLDAWNPTGFKTTDPFNQVFGCTQYCKRDGKPYTLLEVMKELNGSSDPLATNLGFHAVAALLNAAHPNVEYGYSTGDIITLFQNNLHRPGALKDSLDTLNNRGCPLN